MVYTLRTYYGDYGDYYGYDDYRPRARHNIFVKPHMVPMTDPHEDFKDFIETRVGDGSSLLTYFKTHPSIKDEVMFGDRYLTFVRYFGFHFEYPVFSIKTKSGWRILMGCRNFSYQTAIAHWTKARTPRGDHMIKLLPIIADEMARLGHNIKADRSEFVWVLKWACPIMDAGDGRMLTFHPTTEDNWTRLDVYERAQKEVGSAITYGGAPQFTGMPVKFIVKVKRDLSGDQCLASKRDIDECSNMVSQTHMQEALDWRSQEDQCGVIG